MLGLNYLALFEDFFLNVSGESDVYKTEQRITPRTKLLLPD